MIWIILFIIVVLVSFYLAYTSMKGYRQFPARSLRYSLFLILNKHQFDLELLKKIHYWAYQEGAIVSIERLFKGSDSALTIFAPTELIKELDSLKTTELEDYLEEPDQGNLDQPDISIQKPRVKMNESLVWLIHPKNNPKKKLVVSPDFLRMLNLTEQQQFFWQIVCSPCKEQSDFQVTIRAMVVDKEPTLRVNLAKQLDRSITEGTGLIKQSREQPSSVLFSEFKRRTLIPREVSKNVLDSQEILSLINPF
ncbi:hypothetical protein HYS93_01835 [Candidatus Daviesbacteria bacterium]|nr:hypothetical protein [Candidatus Daviesbacteria bacterium]